MIRRILTIFFLLSFAIALNSRPIIGIFTQPSEYKEYPPSNYSYIASSYIKYVEGSGAQAVAIPYDASQEYIDVIFGKINGILFPGGDTDFQNPTPRESKFLKNAIYLIQKAKNATDNGDFFPIWGTCLGFQLINYIESGLDINVLNVTQSSDTASHFIENVDIQSRLFSQMPTDLLNWVQSFPSLYFHHSTYVPILAYSNNKQLASNLKITSTCATEYGYNFVNSFESHKYPIFGSQFHAEKNLYEWKIDAPRDFKSSSVTQYFANFFVNLARQNNHSFDGTDDENKYLIYQYPSLYLSSSSFTQVYIIPNFSQSKKNPSKKSQSRNKFEQEKSIY